MNQNAASTSEKESQRTPAPNKGFVLLPILVIYVVLGFWYSLVVPPFETPDEIYHYAFARHLAAGNPLPVQGETSTGPWEQEGSQAPLYYLITGALTAPVDQSDFDELAIVNPRGNIGDPLYPGNKNRMRYSSVQQPLLGTNLALHVGRWFSLVLGVCTLLLLYRTAKYALPKREWLPVVAVMLVAFMPQFIFISASFSNDSMVVVAAAAAVYWLARLLTRSADRDIRFTEWLILGVLLGLGALSKLQALGLFVLAGGVGLSIAWQKRSWRSLISAAVGVSAPALLIAGWWYWRNIALYGDWSGLHHLTALNGLRSEPLDLDGFWREFRGLRYSFWGLFGWFNILLPQWFYGVMDLVTIIAVVGAVTTSAMSFARERMRVLRRSEVQVRLMLLAWITLSAALLLYWMMRALGSQGRLLFPAMTAIAVWIVIGLDFWLSRLPKRIRPALWGSLPAFLLATSVYGVVIVLPAAYAAPAPVTEVSSSATPTGITFGEAPPIQLLAYEIPKQRYKPGDAIPLTLYLTTDAEFDHDLELFIQLLGVDGTVLGNITTNPGWGRNPTSLWNAGAIYADEYDLLIDQRIDPRSPLLANLYVGFIDPETLPDEKLPMSAYDETGESVTPLLGDIVVEPLSAPDVLEAVSRPMSVQYADGIALTGVTLEPTITAGEPLTVTLSWQATGTPSSDYTAFVHLLGNDGEFVAGFDLPPAEGRLPTFLWREGDVIISDVSVSVPIEIADGQYEVWTGLYETMSNGADRLAVIDAGKQTVANDMVLLGSVDVAGYGSY